MGAPLLVLLGERCTHICDFMCLHVPSLSTTLNSLLFVYACSVVVVNLMSVRRACYHMFVLHISYPTFSLDPFS
jgi:hypothetical protein